MKRFAIAALFLLGAVGLRAADYPQPTPGDFVLKETAK